MQLHSTNLFDRIEIRNLLEFEWSGVRERSLAVADGDALSISPVACASRERSLSAHHRLIRMHLDGDQLAGDLRCSTTELPFESECLQLIVARHVTDVAGRDSALHDELLRILAPGGLLLLFGFNPLSSWRLWWLREALQDNVPMPAWNSVEQMRQRLAGVETLSSHHDYLGGVWPTRNSMTTQAPSRPWHGVWMISARKQRATAHPIPLRPRRKQVVLTPGLAQLSSRRAQP